jgi:hypothetical protein
MIMMPTKLACWRQIILTCGVLSASNQRCRYSALCLLPKGPHKARFQLANNRISRCLAYFLIPIGTTRGLCIFQKRSSDRSGTHRALDRYFNLDGSSVDHAKICDPGWGYVLRCRRVCGDPVGLMRFIVKEQMCNQKPVAYGCFSVV